MKRRAWVVGALILGVSAAVVTISAAQPPPPQRPRPPVADGDLPPAVLEGLFDAYTIMQAQQALKLTDAQFAEFLPRLKSLHDTRRRNLQSRRQLIMELNKMTQATDGTDAQLRDKLRELQELDGRAAAELRRAYENLDQILDARRQARFRVFEQQMERRKFELMIRARENQLKRAGK